MSKKITLGKIVLASTIAFTGGATMSVAPLNTQAESITNVNFELQAKEFIEVAMKQDWEAALPYLSPNLKPLTKEMLSTLWTSLTAPYGKINKTELIDVKDNGVHHQAVFLFTAEAGPYEFTLRLDDQGRVDDFAVANFYPPNHFPNPDYNHSENYIEKQVVIGEGKFSLPGILTVPKGEGPFPVVVLVHGSGPNDMDETNYVSKPFRDMAMGLANEGIAVLRYDKRTNAHTVKTTLEPAFTIQEETVIDANLAVKKLKALPEIDADNIFVLGHSQGGYALPLILKNDKNGDIKGGIGVASLAGKFQDLLLWQLEQQIIRAEKMGAPTEQIQSAKGAYEFHKEQFSIINNPDITLENLPANYQLGMPHWWFGIRDYEPVGLAKEQDVPLLILHGEKDFQVPTTEFDQLKDGLAHRDNVQFKLYPNMMHMLVDFAGEPNGMTEYMTTGNVPEEFISDLSQWIKTGKVSEQPEVDMDEFKDFKADQYWSEPFSWAVNKGIIKGYPGDQLRPNESLKESHLLNIYFRYTMGSKLLDESVESIYELAKEASLPVSGKGSAVVTRGEAAVILAKTLSKKDMVEEDAVAWLYEKGVVEGYKNENGQILKDYQSFKPNERVSRAHFVTMLHRIDQMK